MDRSCYNVFFFNFLHDLFFMFCNLLSDRTKYCSHAQKSELPQQGTFLFIPQALSVIKHYQEV